MSAETQKMDVLAVMDADIDAHEARITNGMHPLSNFDAVNRKRAARTAVAELIESANEVLRKSDRNHVYSNRLRAALARVGGAA